MAGGDTFVRITNRDIYDKMNELIKSNAEGHAEIIIHQKETNGKVRTNSIISKIATTLAILTITMMASFVFAG